MVDQATEPLELIVFGNGGEIEPPAAASDGRVQLRVGASAANLGVAGGRNAAAALATGEWLLFLDDDAVLRPGALAAALETARSDARVGAVAFRVIDPASGQTAVWLYPRPAEIWAEQPFEAPHVVGGGNLIRREVFERLGGFWDGYFREMEEIDFSWRLIDEGLKVLYDPRAAFEHVERTRRLYAYSVPSVLIMLWRLLPPGLALRQTAVKLPLFGWRAVRHGEVGELLAGLRRAVSMLPRLRDERATLRPETVSRLRRMHAGDGIGARLQWSLRANSGWPEASG